MVSPGLRNARYTARFAGEPEYGCTLTWSAPNSAFARSMHELLDLVDVLLALVVALARVALGVLVREHRAGRLEHRARDVVLGRDQPDRVALRRLLGGDQLGDFGVDVRRACLGGRGA